MKRVKLLSLVLACIMLLGTLVSCGNGDYEMPTGDEITVTVIIYDDPRISDPDNEADYTDEDISYIVEEQQITTRHATVLGVMNEVLTNSGMEYEIDEAGDTFSNINGLIEAPVGQIDEKYGYCWSFMVNNRSGKSALTTAAADGDVIEFYYDCFKSENAKSEDDTGEDSADATTAE